MKVKAIRDIEMFGRVLFEDGTVFEVSDEYEHSYIVEAGRDPLLNKQHYAQLSKTDVIEVEIEIESSTRVEQ